MTRWFDVTDNPAGSAARSYRSERLGAASPGPTRSKADIICELARGKRVLDVGCAGHFAERIGTPSWLHGRIEAVAEATLGADLDEAAVDAMNAAGYDATRADIECPTEVADLAERGPFDVVIAGDLIEHLNRPTALLELAVAVLKPGGKLVMSTPNPFAPWRARAGQLGIVWENVDHVVLIFPTGVAEMCDRVGGLEIEQIITVARPGGSVSSVPESARLLTLASAGWLRRLLRRGSSAAGQLSLPRVYMSPLDHLSAAIRRRGGRIGDTDLYVITKR